MVDKLMFEESDVFFVCLFLSFLSVAGDDEFSFSILIGHIQLFMTTKERNVSDKVFFRMKK